MSDKEQVAEAVPTLWGPEVPLRRCANCKHGFPYSDFALKWCKKTRKKVRDCYCAKCRNFHQANYKANNKEKLCDLARKSTLKRYFGLTPAKYSEIKMKQDGKCAICGNMETRVRYGKVIQLAVDHCHRTNKNRGLLCMNCNIALGLFDDSQVILETATRYVRHFAKDGATFDSWLAEQALLIRQSDVLSAVEPLQM